MMTARARMLTTAGHGSHHCRLLQVKVSVEGASAGEKNPMFLSNEEYKDYLRLTDCSQAISARSPPDLRPISARSPPDLARI